MIFAEFPCTDAVGVRLAHTIKLPNLLLRKGRILSVADLEALQTAGIERVTGARLDDDDRDEDTAAASIGALLRSPGIITRPPYAGRCNLYAERAGVLQLDAECIDDVNRISESITLATLPRSAYVRPKQRIATVKIIPFAVKAVVINAWHERIAGRSPLQLSSSHQRRAALIMGVRPRTSERMLEMTVDVTRKRLAILGSVLALVLRCEHQTPRVARALQQALAAGCDPVLIMGANVTKDRGDVVPVAITACGGTIDHFGMPVEPGNMLLLGRVGSVPVINLPGCARSLRHNGIDIVLQRLLCNLSLTPADVMGLGVGGLLHGHADSDAAETEPMESAASALKTMPIAAAAEPTLPRVAALVLAAGRSSRMGERNKLLCAVDGMPLVLHAANAACGSAAVQVMVVTGYQSERIESTLQDLPVSFTHNPAYASGMASSLRCGIRALPRDIDAVIVLLADMPRIRAQDIDRMIHAFDPASPAVLVPEHGGRRGNPVLWPRHHFEEMSALSGDVGARSLIERHAREVRSLAFDSTAIFLDIDTPEALQQLVERSEQAPGDLAEPRFSTARP